MRHKGDRAQFRGSVADLARTRLRRKHSIEFEYVFQRILAASVQVRRRVDEVAQPRGLESSDGRRQQNGARRRFTSGEQPEQLCLGERAIGIGKGIPKPQVSASWVGHLRDAGEDARRVRMLPRRREIVIRICPTSNETRDAQAGKGAIAMDRVVFFLGRTGVVE